MNTAAYFLILSLEPELTLHTPSMTIMSTPSGSVTRFSVRACAEARFELLQATTQDGLIPMLEIIIGTSQNRRTVMRYPGTSRNLVERETPNILRCNKYLPFWLEMTSNSLGFGGDSTSMYQNLFEIPLSYRMDSVRFGGTPDSKSINQAWKVLHEPGQSLVLSTSSTPNLESHLMRTIGRTDVIVNVRSCDTVYIALLPSELRRSSKVHEVAFGFQGNSQIAIMTADRQRTLSSSRAAGILSCQEYRHFWIRWLNNSLTVGHGSLLGEDRVQLLDISLDVQVDVLAFTSDSLAHWTFGDPGNATAKDNSTGPPGHGISPTCGRLIALSVTMTCLLSIIFERVLLIIIQLCSKLFECENQCTCCGEAITCTGDKVVRYITCICSEIEEK